MYAVSRMFSYCQTCCPNLQIWVEADDTTVLACWKEHLIQQKEAAKDAKGQRMVLLKN